MVLLSRKTVLAAKVETTAGTLETLASGDTSFFVYDPVYNHNLEVISRPQQGSFNHNASLLGPEIATITFTIDMTSPSGAGNPGWADVFLPACGWVDGGGGVFSPSEEPPGANTKTLTIGVYKDGRVFRARGCVGTFVVRQQNARPAQIEFTFVGIHTNSNDDTLLSHTPPETSRLYHGQATLTYGAEGDFIFETLTIDAGNQYVVRPSIEESDGLVHAVITDRRSTVTINPEMRLVSGWADPYEKLRSSLASSAFDALAIQFNNGDYGIDFDAQDDMAEVISVGMSDREGIVVEDLVFGMSKSFTISMDTI